MKKRLDNRGFSLPELIVAIAILSVIVLTLTAFMTTGSRAYQSVSSRVILQNESQMVHNQLQEYIIDCNDSIGFSSIGGSDVLTITNDNGSIVHKFTLNHPSAPEEGEEAEKQYLSYSCEDGSGHVTVSSSPVSSMVTGINVTPIFNGGTLNGVMLELEINVSNRVIDDSQTISLRNQPAWVS